MSENFVFTNAVHTQNQYIIREMHFVLKHVDIYVRHVFCIKKYFCWIMY